MPRWTWQECVLWLNIPVSHPVIRGVLATQGDELNIAHLTRRMCLFENSIPLWVLLWESFYIHTHTIQSPVCLSLPDSRTQQLFSLHNPITTVSEGWLVTLYQWLNKRREVFSPPTALRPPRLLYLYSYVEALGSLLILWRSNSPPFWLFTYFIFIIGGHHLICDVKLMHCCIRSLRWPTLTIVSHYKTQNLLM